jgi:hypothetical protein
MLIEAGRDALKSNFTFRSFMSSLSASPVPRAPRRGRPIASAAPGAQEALAQ